MAEGLPPGFYHECVNTYVLIMALELHCSTYGICSVLQEKEDRGTNSDYILQVGCRICIILYYPKVGPPDKCYPHLINEVGN